MNIRWKRRRGLCQVCLGRDWRDDLEDYPDGVWVTAVCGQKRGHRGAHDQWPYKPLKNPIRDALRKARFYAVERPLQWVVCKLGLHGKVGLRSDDGTVEYACLTCKYMRKKSAS